MSSQIDLTQKIITRSAIAKSIIESPTMSELTLVEAIDIAESWYKWIIENKKPASYA